MRASLIAVTALLGCGEAKDGPTDAPASPDAPAVDAAPDAPACPKPLLVGGTTVESQGWSVVMQAPAALTYGADYVRLETSTPTGAGTGGQLLLSFPGALPPPPFRLQVVLLVERVSPHNPLDAAAAIMASFTPPFGTTSDRGQMIYLDAGAIGWAANDMPAFAATIVNNAYHTVELGVDAGGGAQVKLDGAAALSRAGFLTNRAIAIGDQTNDPGVDSAIRLRSVTLLCP